MKYVVFARRFRPQLFREVVGQDAIVTTLRNAIRFDRVAHAYLFAGARGVGKTTLARLFAKALNCSSRGADVEPCNQCSSCLEMTRGQSLDCLEIDGASHRGIDEIRSLNETVGYAPAHGRYRIIIIDEVHMLTKEAFNALLKTLEEPPEHVKFFFATTEPHKVLPTIVSRCQRFDLKRLKEEEIVKALLSIVCSVGREVEEPALRLIASCAKGSLRDAESLLDQLLCFSEEPLVRAHHVRLLLGLVPEELFQELDQAFGEGRVSFAFELVDRLFIEGKQLSHFFEQLIAHYRSLTLSKFSGTTVPYTAAQLLYILDYLTHTFESFQKSFCQKISLEAVLLHIIRSKNRIPPEVLVRRLSDLEQKLSERSSSVQKESATLELTPVPFHPTPTDASTIPERPPTNISSTPTVTPGRHATLLQFAAVELEGTLRT
jgi:DNA polymerase III subunit gamma/tau